AAQRAGGPARPRAWRAGDDREKPALLVAYEPRDRTQRFEFAAALAGIILPAIDRHVGDEGDAEGAEPYPDAPQLLVPNLPHVTFLRRLGRSTRFPRTEGQYAVPPAAPLPRRWVHTS